MFSQLTVSTQGPIIMNTHLSFPTSRRRFLKMSASAMLTTLFAHPVLAAVAPGAAEHHILSFYNIHTGEALKTCYRANGRLIHRAVDRISHIMRDHRTGEIKPVDPRLLDLLHHIVREVKPRSPISIISGYRSPRTNESLRKITAGVAKKSLHIQGRAIDIRIPGYQTSALRELAIDLHTGGVGYYSKSDFVHLDTGPFKVW
jgi:uncharacterized protein YcbK (DUF882 family)